MKNWSERHGFGCLGTLGSDCAEIIRVANSTSGGTGSGTGNGTTPGENPGEVTNQIFPSFSLHPLPLSNSGYLSTSFSLTQNEYYKRK